METTPSAITAFSMPTSRERETKALLAFAQSMAEHIRDTIGTGRITISPFPPSKSLQLIQKDNTIIGFILYGMLYTLPINNNNLGSITIADDGALALQGTLAAWHHES